MIQANELRILNLVNFTISNDKESISGTGYVTQINQNNIYLHGSKNEDGIKLTIDSINPIPLTEEILLKCGFEKLGKYTFVCDNGLMQLEIDVITNKLLHSIVAIEVKHLHQLQNLYFALTGGELEINL